MTRHLGFLSLPLTALIMSCSTEQFPPESQEDVSIIKTFEPNDLNKDGCLSVSEWERVANASTETIVNEASNVEQFRGWILEAFADIDANGNKCITLPEYINFSRHSRVIKE